mmetsp:Transcript_91313/g.158299  ORF Transcript_91313/g.158299 Transcript_91313/m.158299 type:complete len:99 (-) Transcript_91313:107-403(-)
MGSPQVPTRVQSGSLPCASSLRLLSMFLWQMYPTTPNRPPTNPQLPFSLLGCLRVPVLPQCLPEYTIDRVERLMHLSNECSHIWSMHCQCFKCCFSGC